MTYRTVCCFAAAIGLLIGQVAVAQEPDAANGGAEPRVTLPAGATIDQAVAELARATGGVVVAGVAVKERTLQKDLKEASLDEALGQVSSDFDRYWVRRGRNIALQLRYSDPNEPLTIPPDEAQATADDLVGILNDITPFTEELSWLKATYAFLDSITPEQQRAMINGGLPVRALPERQQRTVYTLNAAHPFRGAAREALNLLRLLRSESRWEVQTRRDVQSNPAEIWLRYPHPNAVDGRASIQWSFGDRFRDRQPPALLPSGETRPIMPGPGGTPWPKSVDRMILGEFSAEWARVSGTPFRVPQYGAQRRFWICSVGASRQEAAQALGDLWGWTLSETQETRRLARPFAGRQIQPAARAAALRRAIPPALWHQAMLRERGRDESRDYADASAIFAAGASIAGPEWQQLRYSEFDPRAKQRLYARAVTELITTIVGLSSSSYERYHLSHPEDLIIRLSGPLDPGAQPDISFRAVFESEGRKRFSGWGWTVDSASPSLLRQLGRPN